MSNMSVSRVNQMRMTGLASGLDIDDMVKRMLSSQQTRIDKAKQRRDLVNWQKDSYRSVITQLNGFQSKFLDILSSSSMNRQTSFRQMTTSVPSSMSQFFTASASSDAGNASLTVNSIRQLATAQKIESAEGVSRPVSMTVNESNISSILGQSVSFTVNGETRNITFEQNIAAYRNEEGQFDIAKLTEDMNTKLAREFGTVNGNARVSFANTEGNKLELRAAESTTVQVSAAPAVTGALGFTNNAANFVNMNSSISTVFGNGLQTDSDGRVSFSINGVGFSFARNTTLRDMMAEVNRSSAGVNMSYSTFSDSFSITSTRTGSGDFIRFDDSATNFLGRVFGANEDGSFGRVTQGQDAVLTVNGSEIIRSSNTVVIDGITLNLLQATPEDFNNTTESVTSRVNTEQVMDTIREFIEGYNNLVESLTSLLSERRPRSGGTRGTHFMPLSEEQKSVMKEKDIEQWEEQGKRGLLNNDPTISRMLTNLRTAVMGVVETEGGGRLSFAAIGIKPGSFFEDRSGKLNIDEDVLRNAIENDPDAVMRLFTQQSGIQKGSRMEDHFEKDANGRFFTTDANGNNRLVTQRDLNNMRSSGMGIAQRFTEIFSSNLNVTLNERDRGTLIQKAGTGGANSVIDRDSVFDKRIADMERNITRIQNRFFDLEAKYFRQFSQMETAMTRLNKQSSFLMNFGE